MVKSWNFGLSGFWELLLANTFIFKYSVIANWVLSDILLGSTGSAYLNSQNRLPVRINDNDLPFSFGKIDLLDLL
jgi:hypothetical protein